MLAYRMVLHAVPLASVTLDVDLMALAADDGPPLEAGVALDPSDGRPAIAGIIWLLREHEARIREAGHSPLTLEQLIARHVDAAIRGNVTQFIGLQETKVLLARAEADYPDVVAEVNKSLPLQRITEIFRRLIEEGLSVKDVRTILEAMVQWGPKEKDVILLTEHARIALGRQVTHKYGGESGVIEAILLAPRIEDAMRHAVQQAGGGGYVPAIAPEEAQRLCDQITEIAGRATRPPVLATHFDIRRYIKKVIEPYLPAMPVVSFQEINARAQVTPIGQVDG